MVELLRDEELDQKQLRKQGQSTRPSVRNRVEYDGRTQVFILTQLPPLGLVLHDVRQEFVECRNLELHAIGKVPLLFGHEVVNGFVLFVGGLLALVVDSASPQENVDTKLIQLAFVSLDGRAQHEGKDNLVRFEQSSTDVHE